MCANTSAPRSVYADELYYPQLETNWKQAPPFPYAFPRLGPRLRAIGATNESRNVVLYMTRNQVMIAHES